MVCVGGPAGIGKSRLVHETAEIARGRGVEVFSTFCESHAGDISFHVVARLLRAIVGISDLDDAAARARLRGRVPDGVDPQDLVLLDDLLGIRDPDTELPPIDPAARRRRLTALVNAMSLASTKPRLYILEDAHWIDAVSESMLAEFLKVIPKTPSMALITYRPYYHGALAQVPGAQTVALDPLGDADTSALVGELVGADPSVGAVAALITERTAGNPFFAEEMVRELAERGVLEGERGRYRCHTDVAEVSVPASVQAVIAARIDRLEPGAKQTLSAAAVIGSQFGPDLLTSLGIDPALEALVEAEMVDQVQVHPARRVRIPASVDPRGGLRITTETRPGQAAPAPGRGHRGRRPGIGRGERRVDRREPGGSRRCAGRLWLAYAGRRVVDAPRYGRGAAELGAGARDRRRVAHRRSGAHRDAYRAAHPALWHRLASPCGRLLDAL